MAKKVLIFDGQVFQTSAWDRGMGKYSLSLLEAMCKLWQESDRCYIIFNKAINLDPKAKEVLDRTLPTFNKVFLDLAVSPVGNDYDVNTILTYTEANQRVLDEFIDSLPRMKQAPEFVILSLFLDEICSTFPTKSTNTLLFYDLIPWLFSERYSQNENYNYYLAKMPIIFRAHKILTISQTVADDLVVHLGVSPQIITNIQGAPIKRENIDSLKPKTVEDDQEYLLMVSGNDRRKNNINAVRAFEEYIASTNRTSLRLVITSHFDDYAQEELFGFSEHLIFTGNVLEEELNWLYDRASAVLFVPEYEGLGLPVLEAMEYDKPIVCSSIGAFQEMSQSAFYYTDHHNPTSISEAIGAALNGDRFEEKRGEYRAILKRYEWGRTARLAYGAITTDPRNIECKSKSKLAVITPTPRGYSAIGKVAQQMHASLSTYFDIDYYVEEGSTQQQGKRQSYLEYAAHVYPASEFNADRYAEYTAVLYHIGNSEYHAHAIKNALFLPGFCIFHDTKLPEMFGYLNSHGIISPERFDAEVTLDSYIKAEDVIRLTSLANNQEAIIVHSKYAQKAIERVVVNGEIKVHSLKLPTGVPEVSRKWNVGGINVGMAGVIHEGKGLRFIETLSSNENFANVHFSIFGMPIAPDDVINRLLSNENIHIATNLSDMEFEEHLSQLDVLINYREEYRGETSLSTIEAMRMGIVPIVRNIGWYAELPDSVAIKLNDGAEIEDAIARIVSGDTDIKSMGMRAKKHIQRYYAFDVYSKQLHELVTSHLNNDNAQQSERLKKGQII